MRKKMFLTIVLGSLFFSGCTIMKDTSLISKPNKQKVIVNFVRPSVFFGDGIDVDIWDGDKYLGALSAGSIIQTEVESGKHLFIGNAENLSYISADLAKGKQYFIKANMFPGFWTVRVALGVAKLDDERVHEWLDELTPIVIALEKDGKRVEMDKKIYIQEAISDFEKGKISKFATARPEDGHLILSEVEDR